MMSIGDPSGQIFYPILTLTTYPYIAVLSERFEELLFLKKDRF